MMRNLFGKMFSFLGKREETENQSESEPHQSALESLMSMGTVEANVNNSATVGDDATVIEPTSHNTLGWENVQMDFASKPSKNGVHFSDESKPLMESQGNIGKQFKEVQQKNLESIDKGISPNEFLQQNLNICNKIEPNFVQQDINSYGETPVCDKDGCTEILDHAFVLQSDINSQEMVSAHSFMQSSAGGHSSYNESMKVNLDELHKHLEESDHSVEIQPYDFCMSVASKIETQGNKEAGSEIGIHAFTQPNLLQHDCMENAEILPPVWAVMGPETTVATTGFLNDATHKVFSDEKCTVLSYQSPILHKEINNFEKEDMKAGSITEKPSSGPGFAADRSEFVDILIKEKCIKNDDKGDGNISDICQVRHGREDKDSRKMTNYTNNQGQMGQVLENLRNREPKGRETSRTTTLKSESEGWRSRKRQSYIEEPKDLGQYLSFVKKMTEIGRNVKAKDLVYKLGYLKNVEQSKIEEVILEQYRVAVTKKSTGWIKDARYFCEILFPHDWINENLVSLDGRKDGKWKKKPKKPQQTGVSEEAFTHLISGDLCRDVRLKSDPTLTVIRADMGSGDRGQRSEQVPSNMFTKPSTKPYPVCKQGGLQNLERLENFISGMASDLNEKMTVRMEMFEDKKNTPLELSVNNFMQKETCSEEGKVHEMKMKENGSILTPRKSGEELAIGFNYHSDLLANELSPLKLEATDQDVPSGHREPLESGHKDDSLCNTPRSRKASSDQLALGFSYQSEILAKDSSFSEEKEEVDDLAKVLASLVLQSPLKGKQAIASFMPCEQVPKGYVPEDQIHIHSENMRDAPAGSLW